MIFHNFAMYITLLLTKHITTQWTKKPILGSTHYYSIPKNYH